MSDTEGTRPMTTSMSYEEMIAFHGHKLVISGEKKQPKEDKASAGYLCLERSFGKFSRVAPLSLLSHRVCTM